MSDTIVRCDLCLFYQPKTPNGDLGICRRHAPNAGIWAGPGGLSAYYGRDETGIAPIDDRPNVLWPQVTHSDYCGDGVPSEVAEFPEPEDETFLGKTIKELEE